MKTIRHLIVSTLVIASGAALAQGPLDGPSPVTQSSLTRAEVIAQLAAARANGSLMQNEADFYRAIPSTHQRTRAEVIAETLAAAASGELLAVNGEVGEAAGGLHPGRQARLARALAAAKQAS